MYRALIKLTAISFVLLTSVSALAQKREPFHPERVEEDVANLSILSEIDKIDGQTFESFIQAMDQPRRITPRGFGARTYLFVRPGGYTSIYLEAVEFNGSWLSYSLSVNGYAETWPKVRSEIIRGWQQRSTLKFTEGSRSISVQRDFPETMARYKRAVAAQLGEFQALTAPPNLKEAYDLFNFAG